MNKTLRYVLSILGFLLVIYLFWYFRNIVTYIIIAAVISFIGQPLVHLLDRIKIGRITFPHTLSCIITLFALLGIFCLFVALFVPLIVYEAEIISKIDYVTIGKSLEQPLASIQAFLSTYGILPPGKTIETELVTRMHSLIDIATFSSFFQNLLNITGSLIIGIFSVIFIGFFFLKDEHLFYNGIMLIVPLRYQEETTRILNESKHLLSRYFIGLCLEIVLFGVFIMIGLTILGVKNPLIIAFLAGLLNIIPYVGPLIGAVIGIVLGVAGSLQAGYSAYASNLILLIALVFLITKFIDDYVFQPVIYSKSIKAHPLEVFLVILIAGSLAGIVGMILAIPVYTLVRIIAKEFLSGFRIVQKLTEKI